MKSKNKILICIRTYSALCVKIYLNCINYQNGGYLFAYKFIHFAYVCIDLDVVYAGTRGRVLIKADSSRFTYILYTGVNDHEIRSVGKSSKTILLALYVVH